MTKEDQEHCTAAAEHLRRAIEELDKLSPEGLREMNRVFEKNLLESPVNTNHIFTAIAKLLAA